MATKWQEKGVGFALKVGSKPANRKPVIDDRTGKTGGYEIEHWDDHQDAEVFAKTIAASLVVHEGDDK